MWGWSERNLKEAPPNREMCPRRGVTVVAESICRVGHWPIRSVGSTQLVES